MDMAGALIAEMLSELAAAHTQPKAFVGAYCKVMAGWMEESAFRSGCPIATTMLATAPQSPSITAAGVRAIDAWVEIISDVLTTRPILDVAGEAILEQILVEGPALERGRRAGRSHNAHRSDPGNCRRDDRKQSI